jgi:isopenicillin-N N-acyltransferase-like protein
MELRTIELVGSGYQRGLTHGSVTAEQIQAYTAERMHLVQDGGWTGGELSRSAVLGIASDCLPAHEAFSSDLFEELRGIAHGADISLEEALVVGGFTDFVDVVRAHLGSELPGAVTEDDCTAFLVPAGRTGGRAYFAQTWDMHDSATEFVVMTRIVGPDAPTAMVFTTTGCLGQIGMNELGVTVGINNIYAKNGRPGVTWPLVVREALTKASATEALKVIQEADLSGAHNYLILDADGVGYNIEAMPDAAAVTTMTTEVVVHTNHTLSPETTAVEHPRPDDLQESSENRLERAEHLLSGDANLDLDDFFAVLKDDQSICQVSSEPYHIETAGATVMRPSTGDMWAVAGSPSENDYTHFTT